MKQNQMSETFDILREKIISMEWEPGSFHSVNQVATELGVTRASVDKAFIMLEQCCLMQSKNGKYQVTPLDLQDIVELYQVKEAIETEAIKIILDRGGLSEAQIRELREVVECHEAAGKSDDDKTFFQKGREFHHLILEYSGNRRLLMIHDMIRYQNERVQLLNVILPQQTDSVSEHIKLIDALEKKDLETALAATAEHSNKTIERLKRILSSPYFRRAVLQVCSLYQNSDAICGGEAE